MTMSVSRETGRTVRFAIARRNRTARLVALVVTVGAVVAVLLIVSRPVQLSLG
jgi:hypothetical protein